MTGYFLSEQDATILREAIGRGLHIIDCEPIRIPIPKDVDKMRLCLCMLGGGDIELVRKGEEWTLRPTP